MRERLLWIKATGLLLLCGDEARKTGKTIE